MRYACRCFFEPTIAEEKKTQTLAATHGPFSLASRRVGMAARRPTMRTRSCTPQTKAWFSTQSINDLFILVCLHWGVFNNERKDYIAYHCLWFILFNWFCSLGGSFNLHFNKDSCAKVSSTNHFLSFFLRLFGIRSSTHMH